MIHEESFLGGDFIGHCDRKTSYAHASNRERLPRQLFEPVGLTTLDFCLWEWMKSEVYKRKVDTQDELLARMLDAAARTKKREDQPERTTRDLQARSAKYT